MLDFQDAGSPNTFGDFIDIFLDAEVDSEEISTVGETKVLDLDRVQP